MADPVFIVLPAITGIAQVGRTLVCSPGVCDQEVDTAYQWLRNNVDIADAVGNARTLTTDDQGAFIGCNVTATPAATPPVLGAISAIDLPAKFHIFGGNESSKMLECDFVVASGVANANAATARASNPGLIAMAHPTLDPFNSDFTKRHGFAWTYGGGLQSWTGATDTLSPNAQGAIRGYSSADNGCRQSLDGLQGFKLNSADTALFIAKAIFYAWKLGHYSARGYNGVWSDNLFTGNLLASGNVYGSCGAGISASAWDNGLLTIIAQTRDNAGQDVLMGGNTVYRTNSNSIRAATNAALREDLNILIGQGVDSVWNDMQQMQDWFNVASEDGQPKVAAINDRVSSSNSQRMTFGLAIACCYGAAYAAYDGNHTNTYWPSTMYRSGQRGWLGQPTAPPSKVGSVISRTFEHGTASANFSTSVGTLTFTG